MSLTDSSTLFFVKWSLSFAVLLAFVSPTLGQSDVRVLVTLTGDASKASKSDISVALDGSPASLLELTPVPASSSKFVLLIDVSGSNRDKAQFESSTALNLYGQLLKAGHAGYFGDFNDELYLDRKTSTFEAAKHELQQAPFRGGSTIYDAVQQTVKFLLKQSQTGDALSIIVFTDGEDSGSRVTASGVLKELQVNGIVLHEIILLGNNPKKKQIAEFATLSKETGGTTTVVDEPKDIVKPIVEAFGQEYWITLKTPPTGEHSLHPIQFSSTGNSLNIHGPTRIALR